VQICDEQICERPHERTKSLIEGIAAVVNIVWRRTFATVPIRPRS